MGKYLQMQNLSAGSVFRSVPYDESRETLSKIGDFFFST